MRLNNRLPKGSNPGDAEDPRTEDVADVIDLATRRVLPTVSQRKAGSDMLSLAGGVALVALLGGLTFWSLDTARVEKTTTPTASEGAQTPLPAPAPVPQTAMPVIPDAAITPLGSPLVGDPQQPIPAIMPQTAPAATPAANSAVSPTLIFDAGDLPSPSSPTAPAASTAAAGPAPGGNSNDDFASRLGSGSGDGSSIAAASINTHTTVTQGTLIPAVLETAINTDVPGYVRAIVSADVRSFDGSRVLVPRSSRLIGQYKSGLQAGQRRAYVIWTRLIRPDGVSVNIASPAIGFAGGTGLAGKVDSHFFERFGSAMLLSVLGGLSAVGGNAGIVIAAGGQSAAAAAVGQSAQISPTVKVRQGQPIRVFTARDLDFSKVPNE